MLPASSYSNQSARKLSQFAESAMAVNRVILQQFSMQLNYLNKERSNIYQPSAKTQPQPIPQQQKKQQLHPHHSSSNDSFLMPDLPPPANRQLSGSDDDDIHYTSESSSRGSHPTTPSETSSDEDIQTILDNVLNDTNKAGSGMNNIINKCDDNDVASPLQSRRRSARQLYIVCPTPSG